MFWKNWPYWLKFGITGGILGLLLMGGFFTCITVETGWSQFQCIKFVGLPIYFFGDQVLNSVFTIFLAQFFVFFVPGAAIGFVIDYIKYIKKTKKI